MKLSSLFRISFDLALEVANNKGHRQLGIATSGLDVNTYINEYSLIKLKYPRQIGKTTNIKNRLKELAEFSKNLKIEYYSTINESKLSLDELIDFIAFNKVDVVVLDDVKPDTLDKVINEFIKTLKNENSVGLLDFPLIILIE